MLKLDKNYEWQNHIPSARDGGSIVTLPFLMHACTHRTDAHADSYDSSSELKVGGGGLAAVGAERGWRGTDVVEGWGGAGSTWGGFMIQHECILFIFSRTLPIIGEEPTERKRRGGIGSKWIQMGFSSTSIPTWGQRFSRYRLCGVRSLSHSTSTHPPTPRGLISHHSTWLPVQFFVCANAKGRSCLDRRKNIWMRRGEAGQDVEGSLRRAKGGKEH